MEDVTPEWQRYYLNCIWKDMIFRAFLLYEGVHSDELGTGAVRDRFFTVQNLPGFYYQDISFCKSDILFLIRRIPSPSVIKIISTELLCE